MLSNENFDEFDFIYIIIYQCTLNILYISVSKLIIENIN